MSAQYLSEIEMAKAQRDYELKKAAYDIEVNTRRAQADLAYQLQVRATALGRWPGCSLPLSHSSQAVRLRNHHFSYSNSDLILALHQWTSSPI